jgi:hypothetical protein
MQNQKSEWVRRFMVSTVTTNDQFRRRVGRPAKLLVDHVVDRTWNTTRHAHLLPTDDSVIEMARRSYPGSVVGRLAELQLEYRHGSALLAPRSRRVLVEFARRVRETEWTFVARDGCEFESRRERGQHDIDGCPFAVVPAPDGLTVLTVATNPR